MRQIPREGIDGERVGGPHLPVVVLEGGPVLRQRSRRYSEEHCQGFAFAVIGFFVVGRERQHAFIGDHRTFYQCGKYPAQCTQFIRLIVRSGRECAGRGGYLALNASMQFVQRLRCSERLAERAEYDGEDHLERIVESRQRVRAQVRVLIECRGDPRVSQLQEGSAARAKKQCRFAIDLPTDGGGAEDAFVRLGNSGGDGAPKLFDMGPRNRCVCAFHIAIRFQSTDAVAKACETWCVDLTAVHLYSWLLKSFMEPSRSPYRSFHQDEATLQLVMGRSAGGANHRSVERGCWAIGPGRRAVQRARATAARKGIR